MHPLKYNAGFTMLEVLITLVILSIGLLGLAGLQANGLKSNHQSYMRTQATLLAADMADRMRANVAGVSAGNYNNINTYTYSATPPDCEGGTCTPAEMASYDTSKWKTGLTDNLPSARGTVTTASGIFTITVMWDDERTGVSGTGCSGDSSIDLKCFQMEQRL